MADYTNKEKQKSYEINVEMERTESIQEGNVFQESQDMLKTQKTGELNNLEGSFSDEGVFADQQKVGDALSASYQEEDKKKIKAVKEPEIIEKFEYVSLYNHSYYSVEDSDKMFAVKKAIDGYQITRGTLAAKYTLENVIKACNKYTRGKFSLFKFGKAAQRLREVKAVRENAERELQKILEEEKNLNASEKEERRKDRLNSLKESGPFVLIESERASFVKVRAKEIIKKYPGLSKAEANKFASDAFDRKDFTENTQDILELLEYKKKDAETTRHVESVTNDAVQEIIENKYSSFSAFFVKLFCFSSVKKQFLRDKVLSIAMSKGMKMEDFDKTYRNNAIEMLKILTGLKKSNKTVDEMNRPAKADDNENYFI